MSKRFITAGSAFGLGIFMSAHAALALDVTKTIDVAAAPAAVWSTIGDFCGIGNWHPVVEKCELSTKGKASLRTLSLKGGGTIVERQLARNDRKFRYSYSILSGPLPVDRYKSTISVAAKGTGSTITWTGHFVAKGAPDEKAKEVIGGVYDAGLTGIAGKLK